MNTEQHPIELPKGPIPVKYLGRKVGEASNFRFEDDGIKYDINIKNEDLSNDIFNDSDSWGMRVSFTPEGCIGGIIFFRED